MFVRLCEDVLKQIFHDIKNPLSNLHLENTLDIKSLLEPTKNNIGYFSESMFFNRITHLQDMPPSYIPPRISIFEEYTRIK